MNHIYTVIFAACFALSCGCAGAALPSSAPAHPSPPAAGQPQAATEGSGSQVQQPAESKFPLDISEPRDSSVVKIQTVRVSGRTLPDADLRVNDQFVIVDTSGSFSAMVTLEPGPNSIEIAATDSEGNEEFRLITVMYLP